MSIFKIIYAGILSLTACSSATLADSNPQNASIICDRLLQPNPKFSQADYTTYFDKTFIEKVPFEQLQSIFSGLYLDVGQCTSFNVQPLGAPGRFTLTLTTKQGFEVTFSLVIDQTSNLFTGLLLKGTNNPAIKINSWDDVGVALKSLDSSGILSATLKTTDKKVRLTYSEENIFAIGSTFKLYILGALQTSISSGKHTWDEKLAIRDEWKSLPSGTMQNLPNGQLVSLLDFATNMISISDNTAADHLLYFLGRDAAQSMLQTMNNSHWKLSIPFLSTLEMFKLKWAIPPSETTAYINADLPTKLQTLVNLVKINKTAVGTNGVPLSQPTDISTLEWFGSTEDTCNAILWLEAQNSSEVRQVLSKNVPLLDVTAGFVGSHWSYAGYKGGSEPGVLSMTYLLESKQGRRACLSMSWNNNSKPVSQALFFDIVRKTLKLAESQIP